MFTKILFIFLFFTKLLLASSFTMTPILSYLLSDSKIDAMKENKDLVEELYTQVPSLTVEKIKEPIKSANRNQVFMVPNEDNASWDIIQVYRKNNLDYELVSIDTGSDEVKTVSGTGINWQQAGSVVAPNGKLFIAAVSSGVKRQIICVYDPKTNHMEYDVLQFENDYAGELRPMTLGPDGMIYIASNGENSTVKVVQINPDTLEVVDYGSMGPSHEPNGVWAYYLGVDERYVYVGSGKIPWYLVRYDRKTGEKKLLATIEGAGAGMSIWQSIYGCFVIFNKTDSNEFYYLVDGELVAGDWDNPPASWNFPQNERLYEVATQQSFENLPPEPKVQFENASVKLNGEGEIWVQESGTDVWKSYTFSINTIGRTIYRLMTLSNGKIFGAAKAYEGYFTYDPKTQSVERLGKLNLSIYSMSELNGKVYLSGYPSSALFEYDPSKNWTQNANDWEPGKVVKDFKDSSLNPKFLGYLRESSGVHKVFRSTTASDGNIYFGGRWYRDGIGGGLSWWNPTTQTQDGISDIFSNYMIRYMATTGNGRYVVASCMGVRDDLLGKETPTQGKLFVFDTKTKKIIRTIEPVAESLSTGLVVGVDGNSILGMTTANDRATTIIYRVNVLSGEIEYKMSFDIPSRVYIASNQDNEVSLKVGPDGFVWTFIRNQVLVKINPKTGKIHPIGLILDGDNGGSGEFSFSDGDIYLNGLTDLRVIRDIMNQ